jgi:hypothetical protein
VHRWVVLALALGGCIEQNPSWLATSSDASATGEGSSDGTVTATLTSTSTNDGSSSASGSSASASSDGAGETSAASDTGSSTDATGGSTTAGGRPHRIFLSSQVWTPDGGTASADALCQTLADAQAMGGTFRALLSTSAMPASSRLTIAGPVVNPMDQVVANDAADFWDGTLQTAIGYDELGTPFFGNMWTGTSADGTAAAFTCLDWSFAGGGELGRLGRPEAADSTWIDFNNGVCTQSYPVYCFEQ